MCISRVLRTVIAAFGFFAFAAPMALAAARDDGAAEPTALAQVPADVAPARADERSCPYKLLPGSRIKVRACTPQQRAARRFDRRASTNEAAAIGAAVFSGGYTIASPLPQAQ